MLKANTIEELYSAMNNAEPRQLIQVAAELFFKLQKRRTFVQNYEQSDPETTYCENKDQAQALANFLWNERERHMKDVRSIRDDLLLLEGKWGVWPTKVKAFVKP